MNSQILSKIGLGNLDIGYIIIAMFIIMIAFIVLIIMQMIQNKKIKEKYLKFMQGKNAESMESQIIGLCEDTKFVKTLSEANNNQIKELLVK